MDLIDRQAAIDAVESAKTARTPDGEVYVAKLNAEMNIQILPSAQPERKTGRWILCSERLPESQVEVIVSCTDDCGDTKFRYTSSGWITTDKEYWIVDNEINRFVTAWMPLPEPYKSEDGGGT